MTDFSLTIGPVTMTLMEGADFGQVLQALDFGSTARADVPRLASVRSDMPRAFKFTAYIEADTKDEAIATVSALNRALSVSNTMVVQTKDAAASVSFRTFPSGSARQAGAEGSWELSNWQFVDVALTVEPYAYGDEIVDPHTIAAPTTINLDTMGGDYTAPLAIEAEIIDSGDKLHSLYFALNEHPEWDGWIVAASDLTWTNMSAAVVDATAYGGYHKYTTGTDRAVANVDTKDVPPGDYLVLMRAKMGGASTAALDIAAATRWTETVPATGTTWRYYEVGDLSLPYSLVRGGVSSNMPIGITSSSGTNHCYIDQVVLLPYRSGYCSWHGGTDSSSYWYEDVYFDDDGAVYLDNVCHLENATGAPIHSLAGELIVLTDEKDGDTASTNLTVTLTQTPRYSLYG